MDSVHGMFFIARMVDHSKRERRRQHVIEALEAGRTPNWIAAPICHWGALANYEVNCWNGVTFYCAEHLPPNPLGS